MKDKSKEIQVAKGRKARIVEGMERIKKGMKWIKEGDKSIKQGRMVGENWQKKEGAHFLKVF